jgi:uncharacterized protein involved in outer membrane biogenesis
MPKRYRRPLRIALISGGVLLALAGALVLAANWLLDIPALQRRLQQKLSNTAQGHISWESDRFRLLPYPHCVLRNVKVNIPGRASLAMAQAEADLRLSSLLHGEVEIARVSLHQGNIVLEIPAASAPSAPAAPFDPIATWRNAARDIAQYVTRFAPDLRADADGVGVDVRRDGVSLIRIDGLVLQVQTRARQLEAQASAGGDRWRQLQLSAQFDMAEAAFKLDAQISALAPQPWLERLAAQREWRVGLDPLNVRLHAEAGKEAIRGTLAIDGSAVHVAHGERRLTLDPLTIAANMSTTAAGTQLTLSEVKLGSLLPAARAKLSVDAQGQHPRIETDIPTLEAIALRDAALALAGDQPQVMEYAKRIEAGSVSAVHVEGQAADWDALPDQLTARAQIDRAAFRIPHLEQSATDIASRVEMAANVLQIVAASARLGASRINEASAQVGLHDGSVSVDARYELSLPQALGLARDLAPKDVRAQLDAVRESRGLLAGRIQAKAKAQDWSATVAASGSDAAVALKDLPWPVRVRTFAIDASPSRVRVTNGALDAGASRLEAAAVDYRLQPQPKIESATGRASVSLTEVFPWLRTQPAYANQLKRIASLTGVADVTLQRLRGDPKRPQSLEYAVDVSPRSVSTTLDALPAPLALSGGTLRLDPATLQLDRIGVSMLDAAAQVSGTVSNYTSERLRYDGSIAEGSGGPRLLQWIWKQTSAPQRLMPAVPFKLSASRLAVDRKGNLDTAARVAFENGPQLQVDMAATRRLIDVRRLTIKDEASDASVAIKLHDRLLRGRFSGTLAGRSIFALFPDRDTHPGVVSGEMEMTLDLDLRGRTTAEGRLTARDVDLARAIDRPVRINRLTIEADGQTLHIRESQIDWSQQIISVTGNVRRSGRTAVIDADLESPGVVLDALLPAEETGPPPTMDAPPTAADNELELPHLWPLLVTGRLHAKAGFVQYRQYKVEPVAAELTLEERRAHFDLRSAQMCGIAFPLVLDVTPDGLRATAKLSAKQQGIQSSARCLTNERVVLTGTFDAQADLSTHGKRGELARNLMGTVSAQAHDGRINKFGLLGNILALPSIGNLFKNGPPKLGDEGFPYRGMTVKGRFTNGTFAMEEGTLDSPALGIVSNGTIDVVTRATNLTVLVAPFGRIDQLVRKVPIIGYIIGGTFTSVPVSVTGDIRDPTVLPLDPRAVASELAGIFVRTLKLPAKLLAPFEHAPEPAPQTKP